MKLMKAIQVPSKGEEMKLVNVPIPKPKKEQVLIRVEACGVCNGDSATINGSAPEYPRIPGHEVIGTIKEIGEGSTKWKVGERDRKSTRLNSSHVAISYAVFCLKKKNK